MDSEKLPKPQLEFLPGYFLRRTFTPEEREILESFGIKPCACCEFKWAEIVHSSFCIDRDKKKFTVHIHGIGYDPYGENDWKAAQAELKEYLRTTKDIDCGEDFNKFLKRTLEDREKYMKNFFLSENKCESLDILSKP